MNRPSPEPSMIRELPEHLIYVLRGNRADVHDRAVTGNKKAACAAFLFF